MRFFLLFAALFAASQPALAYDKDKLMQSYFSVVMVRGYNQNGGLAYGSGVVIAKNKVVTNCHVLRATNKPWISRGEDSYAILNVKADVWHDLCLVETDVLPFNPVVLGSTADLKRGQEIVAFGHSNGLPAPLTSTGIVKALYPADHGKMIRSTAKFLMGASGSGLFDLEGKLIGINTFKTAGSGGSIHYALPVEWIAELEKLPETTLPVKGKALWEEDEAKKPFYMQAAVPESRKEWAKLTEIASKWTEAEPKNSDAWYILGLAHEKNSKPDLAVSAYNKAVEFDKTHFEALVQVGTLAKARGDTAEMHRVQLALNEIDKELGAEYSRFLGCDKDC